MAALSPAKSRQTADATNGSTATLVPEGTEPNSLDPRWSVDVLFQSLRSDGSGLSAREAERRLLAYGRNELRRQGGHQWPHELLAQLIHPLALLLWLAAALAFVGGTVALGVAIIVVIALNAAFSFVQERQAERAIEALRQYLPQQATVLRDGQRLTIEAATIVPGDVLLLGEGDHVSADARLLAGSVEVDLSTLTGESQPVVRSAEFSDARGSLIEARDLVFSGSSCISGDCQALVFATGMQTELGRIAALSERVKPEPSPLERQVRRVAWLIALVALLAGGAFLPLGWLVAGLPLHDAFNFAIGLIVANVPEGLLPTITLALAIGVAMLARRGALVKRLSAVETLGSAGVICTDKTGTLTQNQMQATRIWMLDRELDLSGEGLAEQARSNETLRLLAYTLASCTTAELGESRTKSRGEATEIGLLEVARELGADTTLVRRDRHRKALFRFDPKLRLMSAVDEEDGLVVNVKGAPEVVVERCRLSSSEHAAVLDAVDGYARQGLRVLAIARGSLELQAVPARREDVEKGLRFLGLVALFDPPRPEVANAVAQCHQAGIRIVVITGDYGPTAAEIARRVGIGSEQTRVITGEELDRLSEHELDLLLAEGQELIFARSSPEAKLRIADALRARGDVVAMTGDGVNDAPALRRANIGVAMGLTGTDVAREAATMVLTDDNFATIVAAIEAGRQVFDNVRKFILYIFAHATPEVVPFLLFALAGGAIPLPLTVLQILAIDLGTEILPALALGREPAEPGLMERPPRPQKEGVIQRALLVRAWLFLGGIAAALVLSGFFFVLLRAGWRPNDLVSSGHPLHAAYIQATTMTFLGIVACQIGTAVAARTDHASLRSVGILSNRLLLWGLASEVVFAALLVFAPPLHGLFGTATPSAIDIGFLLPFPFIVWGADELRRCLLRRRPHTRRPPARQLLVGA